MSVNEDFNSDDSDEWAQNDLPELPVYEGVKRADGQRHTSAAPDDDDDWVSKLPPACSTTEQASAETASEQNDLREEGSYSMILVDLTQLSNEAIHSKFDVHAVNDPEAVRAWRQKLERDYEATRTNASWIANGIVVPCGSLVWRPALERLRRERPGHYFCPIVPPKEASPTTK